MAGTGPGFYRGTTHEQTPFFENKEAKMLEEYDWPRYFKKGVDLNRVSLDVIKYWISKQVTTILGFEDDIVIDFVLQQLLQQPDPTEDTAALVGDDSGDEKKSRCVDPRKLTFSLTGFMKEQAFPFVSDLWRLLLSAQENPEGIPKEFAEAQEQERQSKLKEAEKIRQELAKLQAQQNGTAQEGDGRGDEDMPDRFIKRDRSISPAHRSRRRHGSRSPSSHYDKRRRRSPGRWSPMRAPRRDDDRWTRRGGDWDRHHHGRRSSIDGYRGSDRDRDVDRRKPIRERDRDRERDRSPVDVPDRRRSGSYRRSQERDASIGSREERIERLGSREERTERFGSREERIERSNRGREKDRYSKVYDDEDWGRGPTPHSSRRTASRRHEDEEEDPPPPSVSRSRSRQQQRRPSFTEPSPPPPEDIIIRRPQRSCYMDEEDPTPNETNSWHKARKPSFDKYRLSETASNYKENNPVRHDHRYSGSSSRKADRYDPLGDSERAAEDEESPHRYRGRRGARRGDGAGDDSSDIDVNGRSASYYSRNRRRWHHDVDDEDDNREDAPSHEMRRKYHPPSSPLERQHSPGVRASSGDETSRVIGRTSSEERLRRLALRKVKRLRGGNESPLPPLRDVC